MRKHSRRLCVTLTRFRRALLFAAPPTSDFNSALPSWPLPTPLVARAVGNGSPHRNYSAICLGDRFYFNGAHMFQTTTAETSQGGLDKTKAGRLPPQQVELTSLRLGGCTKLVRSPRTRSPQGHFGFAE